MSQSWDEFEFTQAVRKYADGPLSHDGQEQQTVSSGRTTLCTCPSLELGHIVCTLLDWAIENYPFAQCTGDGEALDEAGNKIPCPGCVNCEHDD